MYTKGKKTPRIRRPARKVSEIVGKVLEPVLSRRTGMTMDLLTAWRELVGEQYADFTRPQKINWPRRAHEEDPFKPGTLIVACDGARALFFQHDLANVCERVNVFFGFAAIEKIKIVQKPVQMAVSVRRHKPVELSAPSKIRLETILNRIEEPELRETLEKLGKGVFSKKPE